MYLAGRMRVGLASAVAVGLALFAAAPAKAAGGMPTTPTDLYNQYLACSTNASAPVYLAGRAGVQLEAIAGNTDTSVTAESEDFRLWPVSDPTQVITKSNSFARVGWEAAVAFGGLGLPAVLADGQTYAWQARSVDPGGVASDWSAPCYLADDDTFPSSAPSVTSPNVVPGQAVQGGAPLTFTFGSNGVSDVAGYQYTWYGAFSVPGSNIGDHGIPQPDDPFTAPGGIRATTVGGSATVSILPPPNSSYATLYVRSLDRAYNPSGTTSISFWMKPDAPSIDKLSNSPQFGAPTSFKLTADAGLETVSPVVSFTVQHYGSTRSTVTVPASAHGSAEVNVTLDGQNGDFLIVTSTSADGWVSQARWWQNGYIDTTPTVTSDVYTENDVAGGVGVPGTFTFAPKIKGADIAGYTYSFDWGPDVTVAAGAHGVAQVSWTPDTSDWHMLTVYATSTSGVRLASYYYSFTVG